MGKTLPCSKYVHVHSLKPHIEKCRLCSEGNLHGVRKLIDTTFNRVSRTFNFIDEYSYTNVISLLKCGSRFTVDI